MKRYRQRPALPVKTVDLCLNPDCDKCPKDNRRPCTLNGRSHSGLHLHPVVPPKPVFNPDGTPNGFTVCHTWGIHEKWDESRGR